MPRRLCSGFEKTVVTEKAMVIKIVSSMSTQPGLSTSRYMNSR